MRKAIVVGLALVAGVLCYGVDHGHCDIRGHEREFELEDARIEREIQRSEFVSQIDDPETAGEIDSILRQMAQDADNREASKPDTSKKVSKR